MHRIFRGGVEPRLAYDPVLEAYRDTEGYAYNPALDAWKKVWPDGEKPLIPTMTSYADMTNNGVGNASVDSENKGGGSGKKVVVTNISHGARLIQGTMIAGYPSIQRMSITRHLFFMR